MKKSFFVFLVIGVFIILGIPVRAEGAGACIYITNQETKSSACILNMTKALCESEKMGGVWMEDGKCADYQPSDIVDYLQVKVGENPEESTEGGTKKPEGIDVVKKGAAKQLNPMGISGPQDLFSSAINLMLAFMGSIALILYIFAGIMWMTAGGNDERVKKAQRIFVWTTLGALAMGASYMIVRTILERVG